MVLLNALVLVVESWICLAMPIGRYAHGPFTDIDGSISDWEMRQMGQLNRKLNAILGLPDETQKVDVANKRSLKSKLIKGFFGDHGRPAGNNSRKSLTVRRNESTDYVKKPDRTVFGVESECESANYGRPCVCLMADFLDSVCQQLEESATKPTDKNMVTVFECPSYKPVTAAFVIYPDLATSAVTKSAAAVVEKSDVQVFKNKAKKNKHDVKETAVTATWRRVDFDNVINYQDENPKTGRYTVILLRNIV